MPRSRDRVADPSHTLIQDIRRMIVMWESDCVESV